MEKVLARVWRCTTPGCPTRFFAYTPPSPYCRRCEMHGIRAIESKPLERPRLRHAMELQAAQRGITTPDRSRYSVGGTNSE